MSSISDSLFPGIELIELGEFIQQLPLDDKYFYITGFSMSILWTELIMIIGETVIFKNLFRFKVRVTLLIMTSFLKLGLPIS